MPTVSDQEILQLYKSKGKREEAFNILVRKYQERLYYHIRRIVLEHEDADDVIQNTFIKIWNGLENFRAESKMYTWLYRIATNEALTFLKKKRSREYIHDGDDYIKDTLLADPWFNGEEVQARLMVAINKLPEKQRMVFQLKYYEEMKYDQIAEILGTSVGALKASYHHAVTKLKNEMGLSD